MPKYTITLDTDVTPPQVSVQASTSTEPVSPSSQPLTPSTYIAQLWAEAQVSPPTKDTNPGNSVPAGYQAWKSGPAPAPGGYTYVRGFAANVKPPYAALGMGEGDVLLVWAPAGTPYPPSLL